MLLFVFIRSITRVLADNSSAFDDQVFLDDSINFYKIALELFKWDQFHQNVLSWAVSFTGNVVRVLLATRTLGDLPKVYGCLHLLKYAERSLNQIYCRVPMDDSANCCTQSNSVVPMNQDYAANETRYVFLFLNININTNI